MLVSIFGSATGRSIPVWQPKMRHAGDDAKVVKSIIEIKCY